MKWDLVSDGMQIKKPCWFATGVVNKKDFKFDLRINRINLPEQHNWRGHLQLLYQVLYHLPWNLSTL